MGSKFRHILLSKAYRVYAMFVWWHQDESVWSWLHRLPVIVCGSWLYELSDSCMHLMRRGDRRRSRDMDREHLPTLRTTPSTIWPVFSHQRKGSSSNRRSSCSILPPPLKPDERSAGNGVSNCYSFTRCSNVSRCVSNHASRLSAVRGDILMMRARSIHLLPGWTSVTA